jgi:hypothetical protein
VRRRPNQLKLKRIDSLHRAVPVIHDHVNYALNPLRIY